MKKKSKPVIKSQEDDKKESKRKQKLSDLLDVLM